MVSTRGVIVGGVLAACGLLGSLAPCALAQQGQRYLGSQNAEEFNDIRPVRNAAGDLDGYILCGFRDFPVAGGFDRDFYVVRTNVAGGVIWSVRYGEPTREEATSVTPLADGGFAVVGEITPGTGSNLGLGIIKLDAAGNLVWSRRMIGGGFGERIAIQLSRTPGPTCRRMSNGDIALVSYMRISATSLEQRGVFYRFDINGNLLASRQYIEGGTPQTQITMTDLHELNANNEIALVGTTLSPFQIIPGGPIGYDPDPLYMRVNSGGVPLGAAAYPTFGANNRRAVETGDGADFDGQTLTISGFTDFAIPGPITVTGTHVLRVNPLNGAPFWMQRFAGFYNGYAAVNRDFATGDTMVSGFLQNVTGQPLPVLASLLRVGPGGAFVWNRGYYWPGTNSTVSTAVVQEPEADLNFVLTGYGLAPAPYGDFDGSFVRTNNFGLTGCREQAFELRNEPATTDPRVPPITSTASDFASWPAAYARPGTADTAFCAGVGCCSLADLTDVGGSGPPCDGQLTLDDILLFVNEYNDATGCPGPAPCNLADLTGLGGPPSLPDGQLTLDDILAFTDAYNDGCL